MEKDAWLEKPVTADINAQGHELAELLEVNNWRRTSLNDIKKIRDKDPNNWITEDDPKLIPLLGYRDLDEVPGKTFEDKIRFLMYENQKFRELLPDQS